jgi:hypothetical protein
VVDLLREEVDHGEGGEGGPVDEPLGVVICKWGCEQLIMKVERMKSYETNLFVRCGWRSRIDMPGMRSQSCCREVQQLSQ